MLVERIEMEHQLEEENMESNQDTPLRPNMGRSQSLRGVTDTETATTAPKRASSLEQKKDERFVLTRDDSVQSMTTEVKTIPGPETSRPPRLNNFKELDVNEDILLSLEDDMDEDDGNDDEKAERLAQKMQDEEMIQFAIQQSLTEHSGSSNPFAMDEPDSPMSTQLPQRVPIREDSSSRSLGENTFASADEGSRRRVSAAEMFLRGASERMHTLSPNARPGTVQSVPFPLSSPHLHSMAGASSSTRSLPSSHSNYSQTRPSVASRRAASMRHMGERLAVPDIHGSSPVRRSTVPSAMKKSPPVADSSSPATARRSKAPSAMKKSPGAASVSGRPVITKSPEVRAAIVRHVTDRPSKLPHTPLETGNESADHEEPKSPPPAASPHKGWKPLAAPDNVNISKPMVESWPTPREQAQISTVPVAKKKQPPAGFESEELSGEELRAIETALRESRLDAPKMGDEAAEYDFSGASDHLTQDELLKIQQALNSDPSDENDADAKLPPDSSGCETESVAATLEEDEAELIARALREADEEEERKSIALALKIQQEEAERQLVEQGSQPKQQGNVRTMSRQEFQMQNISSKFRREQSERHPTIDDDDLFGEDDNNEATNAGFRLNSSTPQKWARSGQNIIIGPNKEVRTKHDPELHGQANAHRLGLDEDEFASVGNQAYNSFMKDMKGAKKGVTTKGSGRAGTDRGGTKSGAMDEHVRNLISRAINSELIERCNGVVKEGKEAVIYHADKGKDSDGYDVAVKVFKRIQEFRGRGEYVDGDPRYGRENFKDTSSREKLELWAEKEFRNLLRANKAGVPVPSPLMLKENIVYMRFLGEEGFPAPQLRDLDLRNGSKRWTTLYRQVLDSVKRLYQQARLVHGDLSEYNILVVPADSVENKVATSQESNELQIVLIDFGQAVDIRHPSSDDLLRRDVVNVLSFFRRQGVATIGVDEALAEIQADDAARE